MQSFYTHQRSKRTKIILIVGALIVVALIIIVGWLIIRVTHDQPQTTIYNDENKKDNGNGLGTSESGDSGLSLQGLPIPGQSTNSSNSSAAGSATTPTTSGSSANTQDTTQNQQPIRSQTLPNGLKIDEYNLGAGTRITKVGDTIAVHYIGYLPDGKVFDTSLKGQKQPFAFKLGAGQVIQGWDIGLQDMKVGAVRRLTIPAALAYGARGYPPTIAPNTPLVFDTQLMGIQ
ncbi:MAG: FKBP-type peptidyl-prolyl cis-trans isomerase [Candidatus Saccharibacteria bacterium]